MIRAFRIRKATGEDAAGISAVLATITSERIHSAIDQPWKVDQQRSYIDSLSPREAFHVAVSDSGEIGGFQSLDLWSPVLSSMSHVGQLGTFLMPRWRRCGAGRALWKHTEAFARQAGYKKLVIQVRGSNRAAQAFYQSIGFSQCGRLARQVVIDGEEDDEILMEAFL